MTFSGPLTFERVTPFTQEKNRCLVGDNKSKYFYYDLKNSSGLQYEQRKLKSNTPGTILVCSLRILGPEPFFTRTHCLEMSKGPLAIGFTVLTA